jgi:hypothetical protein
VSGAERQAAEALAQAQGFAPIEEGEAPAGFDYETALNNARRVAMQQINRAMPVRGSGETTPKVDVSLPSGLGRISDLFGKVTLPYQKLPKGATLTDQQIKRLAEAQDIQALRQRGL